MASAVRQSSASPWRWLALFAALALALIVAAVAYYRWQASEFREQAERQLLSVVQLKVDELEAWRRERLSDARFFSNNASLGQLVARSMATPEDAVVRAELASWFRDTQQSHGYWVVVTDRDGATHLAEPGDQPPLEQVVRDRIADVLASGTPEFVDFHRVDGGDGVRLSIVMPIRAPASESQAPGALVWRLDPASSVYPVLQWPVESATAELLLVRPEQDGVVLLSPPRGVPLQALGHRVSFSRPGLESLRTEPIGGVREVLDYRGIMLLSASATVPGTPWTLVAAIQRDEVLAPLWQQLWSTVVIVGALLVATGASVGLLWRQQAANLYRTQLRAESTMRVQAEALRRADELLRFQVENSPLALIEWDDQFRVIRWSPRAEVIFGWSADEVLGRRPQAWHFIHPDDTAGVEHLIADLVEGRAPRNQNVNRNLTRDGRIVHCEWYNSVRHNAGGGVASILSLVDDVTDRVRAEEDLRALNDELERRVQARTAELEAKNRELEVFTYSVSHDLKAPLRGIEGYSRLLVDDHADALDDEARLFLQNIRQAASNMGRLIDDLLAYSRLERRPTQMTEVSLSALVHTLLAERALEIETRGAVISTRELGSHPVRADAQALSVALGNLLDNALKFTQGASPPTIEIGIESRPEGTRIWVRDNGIGLDMKYADRIFDIFQRLHRAEDYPGTGIGLAIVRKSMERMGGHVRVESRPDAGATFSLELPA